MRGTIFEKYLQPKLILILQGYHDQAIDRLVQHCKGEELLVQLKKMLKYRHERCAKLEENASDLKREIQALKAAGASSKLKPHVQALN